MAQGNADCVSRQWGWKEVARFRLRKCQAEKGTGRHCVITTAARLDSACTIELALLDVDFDLFGF
jgi:hypothetical protein